MVSIVQTECAAEMECSGIAASLFINDLYCRRQAAAFSPSGFKASEAETESRALQGMLELKCDTPGRLDETFGADLNSAGSESWPPTWNVIYIYIYISCNNMHSRGSLVAVFSSSSLRPVYYRTLPQIPL